MDYQYGNLSVKKGRDYTYSDYTTWPEEERWEIIEGVAYAMAPAPGTIHQQVSMQISIKLGGYLESHPCRVFAAPFDVCFPQANEMEEQSTTVVQPDISVICDPSKITERGCVGAPDLIMEILSPTTAFRDQAEKLRLYESRGVKEYWIINPGQPLVMKYVLQEGKYPKPELFDQTDTISCDVIPGFRLVLKDLFAG